MFVQICHMNYSSLRQLCFCSFWTHLPREKQFQFFGQICTNFIYYNTISLGKFVLWIAALFFGYCLIFLNAYSPRAESLGGIIHFQHFKKAAGKFGFWNINHHFLQQNTMEIKNNWTTFCSLRGIKVFDVF